MTTNERNQSVTVGLYHPKAGVRSAGGVAMYVQKTAAALAERYPTVLYTEGGDLTETLRRSNVETLPIHQDGGWRRLRKATGHLPVTLNDISPQISESVSAFVNAALDGTLRHVEEHVDVLFTHHLQDTMLLSKALDIPVVHVFHGCRQAGVSSKSMLALSSEPRFVANSRQTASEVRTRLGRDVEWVAYPGVDIDIFRPSSRPAFESPSPTVLFVGRFVRGKGVFDLLEAFARIDSEATLRLVGRGDGARLENRACDLGLSDTVTVEGEVPHDRLPQYYAAASVVCLPTHYESFGMVNVEAMACGTPVVTTNLPGIREYATDGENALLVPPGDVGALATALEDVLSSPTLAARLGESGRETAECYSWNATADRFSDIADAVVSPRRSR